MPWSPIGFLISGLLQAQENDLIHSLTLEDINALRAQIFSRNIDYERRVQVASTLTRWFEIQNRSRNARRLCLDFYDSLASILEDESPSEELQEPFIGFAQAIDRGKRQDTAVAIEGLISNASDAVLHPGLSLLALKAETMAPAYRVLFADFTNQKLTPYSLYVFGILAAREKRFIEGERFLMRAKDRLGSPILERWLSIDLAKLFTVNKKNDEARQIVRNLLEKNPQDPQALNISIFNNLDNKKDLARQQLSQLINLLYPDPYLIAETAKLAIQLMELDTAARILEQYESKVEPSRDFFEVFAFVRKNQGKQQEAEQYLEKARRIHDSRVAVTSAEPLRYELKEAVADPGEPRRDVEWPEGVDTLSKAYYRLLDEDYANAIAILQANQSNPYESFILAAIQRRSGDLTQAALTLQQIKAHFPEFHPYEILSLLADYAIRRNDTPQALAYYREILDRFPESYQADAARKVCNLPADAFPLTVVQSIEASPRMSRYSNYAAPFLVTEIREHWGDSASFATFTNLLQVSPRRGILFHEFVTVLASITRHQVIPFIGIGEGVLNCLRQDIPVIFCQGDMFDNQLITELAMLTGGDERRGIFYAEGVTPYEPHLFTEKELLEGICFAVYPSSLEPQWPAAMTNAIERGKEFIKLHLDASHIRTDPDYDAAYYTQRQQSILSENDIILWPIKLAFARWTIRNKPGTISGQYLQALEEFCRESAHYWFISAVNQANQKNSDRANQLLEKALKRCPENPRFLLAQVRILDQTQKMEEAIALTENLRYQYPENTYVSYQLLLLYRKAGEIEKGRIEEERLKKILNVEIITIDDMKQGESFSP